MPRTTMGRWGPFVIWAVINDYDQLRHVTVGFRVERTMERMLRKVGRP